MYDLVPSRKGSKGGAVRIPKKPTRDELGILLTQIQDIIEKANAHLENKKHEEGYIQALIATVNLDKLLKVKESSDKTDW